MKGQTLVEFALVLPILMFMMLGFAELAFLFANRQGYQDAADVLVDWAAEEMSSKPGDAWTAGWDEVIAEESSRVGCDGPDPTIEYPDGTNGPGDRIWLDLSCSYQPRLIRDWIAFDVQVQSAAVVPGTVMPEPSGSP